MIAAADTEKITSMKETAFKLPDLSRKEFIYWVFRRRKRMTVVGASMYPLLKPGDEVLWNPFGYRKNQPEIGDIVIAWHPGRSNLKIIKRISAVLPDGTLNLQGENPFESTDYFRVPASKILGKVTCIFLMAEEKRASRSQ